MPIIIGTPLIVKTKKIPFSSVPSDDALNSMRQAGSQLSGCLCEALSHKAQIPLAGGFHIAGRFVLLNGEEALKTDGLQGVRNRLEIHDALADMDELPHQPVNIAHMQI